MCLFRRPRFLIWLCLNIFFGVDILLNSDWVANNRHQLDSVNVDRVSPLSASFTRSSFSFNKTNDEKVRLLCWIPSSSAFASSVSHEEQVILETWGKRCDRLVFIFTTNLNNNKSTGQVIEKDDAGVIRLFGRTLSDVLPYLYDYHFNDSDWFLKADEDTYVVMEELKAMLSIHDTKTPCYLAANDKEHPAMTDGAYVLSSESIRRLVHHLRHQPDVNYSPDDGECNIWSRDGNSDKSIVSSSRSAMRKCLHRLGIVSKSTRDERGCQRFLSNHLANELVNNPTDSEARCISPSAVIFSRIHYNQFHVYEHLLYRLRLIANVGREF